jgi:hypothetical protein
MLLLFRLLDILLGLVIVEELRGVCDQRNGAAEGFGELERTGPSVGGAALGTEGGDAGSVGD